MIPVQFHTLKPVIQNRIRVATLTSGSKFGEYQLGNEHMMERMNNFVRNIDNPEIERIYQSQLANEYPDLAIGANRMETYQSDFNLKDTNRLHMGIEERYRKKKIPISEYRKISDPVTRLHRAMSRGVERQLVDAINTYDNEVINQKSIRPNIDGTQSFNTTQRRSN